jgi:ABC-type nitrate/sulfonate/bicarbonate transport system substrate-binding protein
MITAVVALALVAAACGNDEGGGATGATGEPATGATGATTSGATGPAEMVPLTIVTEWPYPDPLWIPFLAAQDQGYYADAGLDVTIQTPPDNSTTMKMLAAGDAQVGLSATTDVVFACGEGLPIQSISNMTQSNNWGLFQLGDQPIDVASLAGKTVGIYNDSWTATMLPIVLASGGLTMDDVKTVAATASVIPLLLRGKIDVATEVTNLGGVEITTSGGGDFTQLLGPEAGTPDTPVWVYVANSEWAAANPDLAAAWLAATRQGIEWASQNPEDAVALFEQAYPEAATDNGYNLEAWQATIPLLTVSGGYPEQTDEEWSSFAQALVDAGQLDSALAPGEYYTNDYLPA